MNHRAYLLMVIGIVIVMLAYAWLLCVGDSFSVALPIVVAVLGFIVSTLGFASFAVEQHRRRASDPLGLYEPGARTSVPGRENRSSESSGFAPHWDAASRNRSDFTQRN